MRRHIPGLHSGQQSPEGNLDGLFLVRVDKASYRWHPQKPFLVLDFVVLEPTAFQSQSFPARLYCLQSRRSSSESSAHAPASSKDGSVPTGVGATRVGVDLRRILEVKFVLCGAGQHPTQAKHRQCPGYLPGIGTAELASDSSVRQQLACKSCASTKEAKA
jgi:hypothetical protein